MNRSQALNWNDKIERDAALANWEIGSMAWLACEEIGCLDEFEKISSSAKFRREIIEAFRVQT